jgi:PPOX class probable F420-dependent enzyme
MQSLSAEKYLSLATFRKSGKEVKTPVWFAEQDGKLYVFTMADSGKVKRLRNSSRSRIAACDMRGNVHGDWVDADTVILDNPADQEKARLALRRKYRLQMLVADVFGFITGRRQRRAYLEITPA